MAQFPRRESDVLALANAMVDGYTAHPADFPNADAATLGTVREDYKSARLLQICLIAVAKLRTDEKDAKLDALTDLMRVQLEQSEVDVAGNPEALRLLGWGPEAPGQPSRPPGQPLGRCMRGNENMKCEFCNADTVTRLVKKQHWFKGRLYIVEKVEAEVCPECGERYFHATTLDTIDQMIAGDHAVKEVLSVEVLRV